VNLVDPLWTCCGPVVDLLWWSDCGGALPIMESERGQENEK